MRAITDFAATREQIAFAVEVFGNGFAAMKLEEEINRDDWIEEQTRKDWFRRSRKYWTRRANGEIGDVFECYEMRYKFQPTNYVWYEARLKDAQDLLKRFDCAVDTLEAVEVTMGEKDLTLLSISLQSALEP